MWQRDWDPASGSATDSKAWRGGARVVVYVGGAVCNHLLATVRDSTVVVGRYSGRTCGLSSLVLEEPSRQAPSEMVLGRLSFE